MVLSRFYFRPNSLSFVIQETSGNDYIIQDLVYL